MAKERCEVCEMDVNPDDVGQSCPISVCPYGDPFALDNQAVPLDFSEDGRGLYDYSPVVDGGIADGNELLEVEDE